MSHYRIIIADDHILLRAAIRTVIEGAQNLVVVGEAGDGLEVLNILKKIIPHMVILDISMPKLGGFETTREIKANYPGIKIMILSMHKNIEYLYNAICAGADGYLLKEHSDTELFTAIETVRKGKLYLSTFLLKELKDQIIRANGIKNDRFIGKSISITSHGREALKQILEDKLKIKTE